MAGVLHKLLHTYTDTAISVTTGLVTSITRFAVQVHRSRIQFARQVVVNSLRSQQPQVALVTDPFRPVNVA